MGIEYLFMAVLGGIGHVWGALVGAGVVQILKDQLQVILPRLMGTSGNYEIIVFGVLLVLMLQYARDGLWSFVDSLLPRQRRKVDWADAPPLPTRARPAHGEVVLDVRDARKEFGGLVAVNDVSFQVKAGEILGLIGPNGAGKSTTFNLVTGVLPATRGQVTLLGKRIDSLSSRRIARLGMARTFQHVKMIPGMTVLENVALGAHLRGRHGVPAAMLRLDRAEERRLMKEAERQLQRIGIGELMHEQAGNLALGQQRLMEIARALAADPTLLLLDEPAAGLRLKEKEALADVLRQLRGEGHHDPPGRARHGPGDGPGRPGGGDGVRHQADRRHAGSGAGHARRARRLPRHGALMRRPDDLAATSATCTPATAAPRCCTAWTLTADDGQVVTVIGPNGAGKSTLLNALMGVLPSRGTVEYQGESVALLSLEERVWRGMALVPETRELFATMPVEDNLLLGAWRRFRVGARTATQELNSVYMLFPRLHERRTPARRHALRRRAADAGGRPRADGQALAADARRAQPGPGAAGGAQIFATIAALRSTGVTILLVEQNARAALEVADYGYVLEMGEVALQGPAEELARDPRVIETYLGAARKKSEG